MMSRHSILFRRGLLAFATLFVVMIAAPSALATPAGTSTPTFQVGIYKSVIYECSIRKSLTCGSQLPDGLGFFDYQDGALYISGTATPNAVSKAVEISCQCTDSNKLDVNITITPGPQTIAVDYGANKNVDHIYVPVGTAAFKLDAYAKNGNGDKLGTGGWTLNAPTLRFSIGGGTATVDGSSGLVTPGAAGNTTININADATSSYTAADQKTINLHVVPLATTPNVGIDYVAETLTGLVAGDYTFGGGAKVTISSTTQRIEESWMANAVLAIIKKGDGTTIWDSAAQDLRIPSRPTAPSVNHVDESVAGRRDGKITGVDTKMEWSADNGTNWTDCTGTEIRGLAPGSYLVRVKAVAGASGNFKSENAPAVTIAKGPNPPTPQDPKPNANPNTVVEPGQGLDIKIDNVRGDGTPVLIEIRDENGNVAKTITGTTGADGKLHVDIPGDLPPGQYTIHVSSPGNDLNKGFEAQQIGTLRVKYKPTLTGNNTLVTLPGYLGELSFGATLSGSDPKNATPLTVKLGGKSGALNQTGDGALQLRCAMDPAASGTVPVIAFAPETPTSEAIPETPIGSVTVASLGSLLAGDLAGKLGEGWSIIEIADGVSVALQGAGLRYNPLDGTVTIKIGEGVKSVINFGGKGSVTARIETVNASRFGQKSAQPVPGKQVLVADGTLSKAKKLATFSFTDQEMARLDPGLYRFSIESQSTGKLNLATVQVVAAEKEPVGWTIPQTLRVSVGQQYQLVKPLADGNVLPELTVKSGNKKIATIDTSGVLTAKRSGTATISIKDQDGGTLKCKLTVVSNSFSRSRPLHLKGVPGLYTSTKRLSYEKGVLKAEVFVANTTGQTINNSAGFILELYDGETLVYSKPIGPMTFTLKNKKYGVYKLTLTNDLLPGVSAKAFDLGSNRYQAVIRGDSAVPLIASTKGAVQAKSSTFGSAGTMKSVQTNP